MGDSDTDKFIELCASNGITIVIRPRRMRGKDDTKDEDYIDIAGVYGAYTWGGYGRTYQIAPDRFQQDAKRDVLALRDGTLRYDDWYKRMTGIKGDT